MTRRSDWVWGIAALALLGGLFVAHQNHRSFVRSQEDHGYYYRFVAKLSHGAEELIFDTVVGCNVQITGYADGDRSVDVFKWPDMVAKMTKDGHWVTVDVPTACRGETTASGKVPADLFPSILWHPVKEQLGFAVLYATEDAFESPLAQLKFHGATISTATRDAYLAWRKEEDAKNPWTKYMLAGWDGKLRPKPLPPEDLDKIRRNGGWMEPYVNSTIVNWCDGVNRFRLPDEMRALVRQHWPQDHPRYWRPEVAVMEELESALRKGSDHGGPEYNGHSYWDYIGEAGWTQGRPTHAGGGYFGPYDIVPPVVFPTNRGDTPPFYSTDQVNNPILKVKLDLRAETRGFTNCGIYLDEPAFIWKGHSERIDYYVGDELIRIPDRTLRMDRPGEFPSFFENDEFFYEQSPT